MIRKCNKVFKEKSRQLDNRSKRKLKIRVKRRVKDPSIEKDEL